MSTTDPRYESFVFAYVGNVVSGGARKFGVLLRERRHDNLSFPRRLYLGIAFPSESSLQRGFFRGLDKTDAEVIRAFIAETRAKVSSFKDGSDMVSVGNLVDVLTEANSGIVAQGPFALAVAGDPEIALNTLLLENLK